MYLDCDLHGLFPSPLERKGVYHNQFLPGTLQSGRLLCLLAQLDLERHILVFNDRIVEKLKPAQYRVDNDDTVGLLYYAFLTFKRLRFLLWAQPLLLFFKILQLFFTLEDNLCLELKNTYFAFLELY
jgi:hypothetical protein